jgi:inorganic pyrophosphatase/exopolyphosphatase
MEESMFMSKKTKKVLIIGMSRSGTSLLQRLLNAYPGVFITYESIYMPFFYNNKWQDVHAYYYEILKQYKHLSNAVHRDLPNEDLKPFTFAEEYLYFGDKVIYSPNKKFRNTLKKIRKSQNVDKVIFIVRDPRARSLSLIKWVEKRNIDYRNTAKQPQNNIDLQQMINMQSNSWNQFTTDALTYSNPDHFDSNSKFMLLKYEDVVSEADKYIDKILIFLGLEPSLYPKQYLKDVNSKSVEKWKKQLTPNLIEDVENITINFIKKLSY